MHAAVIVGHGGQWKTQGALSGDVHLGGEYAIGALEGDREGQLARGEDDGSRPPALDTGSCLRVGVRLLRQRRGGEHAPGRDQHSQSHGQLSSTLTAEP